MESRRAALSRARGRVAALAGGGTTNEEAFLLQRLLREGLDSGDLDSRLGGPVPLETARALAAPALQATVPDVEFAHAVLVLDCEPMDDMPILDLRIRKGVRRHGVRLAVATSRPTRAGPERRALRPLRAGRRRGVPRRAGRRACRRGGHRLAGRRGRRRRHRRARAGRACWAARGEDIVVVWGERLAGGPRAGQAGRALLNVAARLGLAGDGAGLLEVPSAANGRGLREAGFLPDAGPGLARGVRGRPLGRGDRPGARRRRGERPVAAARRSPSHPPRPRRLGAWARAGDRRDRPRLRAHRGRAPSTRPWCSRRSPTPRRRARSPIPTAASSACGRPSADPPRCARAGG